MKRRYGSGSEGPSSNDVGSTSAKKTTPPSRSKILVAAKQQDVAACTSCSSVLESGRLYLTRVSSIPDCFNDGAFSLSDLLASIQPELSVHFNFMVELDWVLRQYPESCRASPISFVVGQKMGTDAAELRRDVKALGVENIQIAGAALPIPFGTHHTKLSIMESSSRIHVVVSTANLVEGDWKEKTQMFYYCTGTLDHSSAPSESVFQNDLMDYLKRYKLPLLDYWIERIAGADFHSNADRFICSSPGYHKGVDKDKLGHLALRRALSGTNSCDASALFVAQCSSIGSLGARPEQWLFAQFLNSLRGGQTHGSKRLFLIYPTVADVRNSLEGYNAGGSLPYQSTTHAKQQWLRGLMCRWRSETRGRNHAMPHVKTYCEFGSDRQLRWQLVTSANLSKAAWGEVQKNGEQLAVRSWEAGVLIQDPARCVLSFDYPLCRYQAIDDPWIVDKNYSEVDSLGGEWIYNKE